MRDKTSAFISWKDKIHPITDRWSSLNTSKEWIMSDRKKNVNNKFKSDNVKPSNQTRPQYKEEPSRKIA